VTENFARGSATVRQADELPEMRAYPMAWDPFAQQERWRVLHDVPTEPVLAKEMAGELVLCFFSLFFTP